MTLRQARFARILTALGEPRRGSFVRAIRLSRRDDPLSAVGSMLFGGRYNARGSFEVLYLGENSDTATREVRLMMDTARGPVAIPQAPIVLMSLDINLQRVADLTKPEALDQLGITERNLLANWDAILERGQTPTTQTIGAAAYSVNLEGLLVPSKPHPGTTNLVVFPDNLLRGSYVRLHDATGFPAAAITSLDGTK